MAKVELLVPFIKKHEGGFSNHPNDTGGATMAGVTLATFQSYRKAKGLPSPTVTDLKNISDAEWTAILKWGYWDRWKADEINYQPVAHLLVGWAWGSGADAAIRRFQKLMKLQVDGIVGKNTLAAINSANGKELFWKLILERKDWFVEICDKNKSQMVFLKGWLNRLFDNIPYNYNLAEK